MTSTPHPPIRRILDADELDALHERVQTTDSPALLLVAVLDGLYDLLTGTDDGRPAERSPREPLDPAAYEIPATQWRAIAAMATGRAAAWGVGAEIGLALADRMPATFDLPEVPTPSRPALDHRPDPVEIRLSRRAADTIRACEAHLDALGTCFGTDSPVYGEAARSWRQLAAVFTAAIGSPVHVGSDGQLGLHITSPGITMGLVFHGAVRRCTIDGCHARIDDAGHVRPAVAGAEVADHEHTLSYALGEPRPGRWVLHS